MSPSVCQHGVLQNRQEKVPTASHRCWPVPLQPVVQWRNVGVILSAFHCIIMIPFPAGSNQWGYAAYRVGLAVLMVAGIVAHIIEFTGENPGWKWTIYMTNQVRYWGGRNFPTSVLHHKERGSNNPSTHHQLIYVEGLHITFLLARSCDYILPNLE